VARSCAPKAVGNGMGERRNQVAGDFTATMHREWFPPHHEMVG